MVRTIRTTAFRLDPEATATVATYQTLSFPSHWVEPLLELCRAKARYPDKTKAVPIRRLNELFRAVAPDLVSVATEATRTTGPWLFTHNPLPPSVLAALINTWIIDLYPDPQAHNLRREVMDALRPADLEWQSTSIDLTEHTVSPGGTVLPTPSLYHLLPDILARQILIRPPFEFNGQQLRFRAIAARKGAELVSWPPRSYLGPGGREWKFSFLITVSLQSVPFSDHVRVHVHTGIRRWVSGRRLYRPPHRGVTCYLSTDAAWLGNSPGSTYLAAATLDWSPRLQSLDWRYGGPDGMLQRLTFDREFPDPKLLATEPDSWLHGHNGITAAVTHHTMMGTHGVGAGLMPADRAPLLEWIKPALQPQLRPLPDLPQARQPTKPLNPPAKVPAKDKQTPGYADQRRTDTNDLRRQIANATRSSTLTVEILYQTDTVNNAVTEAIVESLGLPDADTSTSTLCLWQTDELAVQLHRRRLGPMGALMPPSRTSDESDTAIAARRSTVRDEMGARPDSPRLALVEIADPKDIANPSTDPKFPVRLGLADSGRISQFLLVPDPKETQQHLTHRAQSAWEDGLRQLGVRSIPQHSLGPAVPESLQYLALWMLKRRADGPTRHSSVIPVAVLVRPDTYTILGRVPGMTQWVPYPELLLTLAAQGTRRGTAGTDQRPADTPGFLNLVLYGQRGRPTLLLTHAQNTRNAWPWIQNGNLVRNQLQFGDAPAHEVSLAGPHLRVLRVRTSQMGETPQWFNPTAQPGLAAGLWEDPTNPYVFASTTEKASTAKTAAVAASKLVPRKNLAGNQTIDTGENAWNPQLLEIAAVALQDGDDPAQWAAVAHQLRYPADYRDPLALPMPMHLAQLCRQYVLPHDDDRTEPVVDVDSEGSEEKE